METKSELEQILKGVESQQSTYRGGTMDDRIVGAIRHYQTLCEENVAAVRHFKDDIVIELRALTIVLETVLGAGTHGEKNARLRGLLEMLGAMVRKVSEQNLSISWQTWRIDGRLSNDGIVVNLMQNNRDLQRQVDDMRNAYRKLHAAAEAGGIADVPDISILNRGLMYGPQ